MDVESNKDSRGVARGGCEICASCTRYVKPRGPGSMKCETCQHAPGKHENLTSGLRSGGGAAVGGNLGRGSGGLYGLGGEGSHIKSSAGGRGSTSIAGMQQHTQYAYNGGNLLHPVGSSTGASNNVYGHQQQLGGRSYAAAPGGYPVHGGSSGFYGAGNAATGVGVGSSFQHQHTYQHYYPPAGDFAACKASGCGKRVHWEADVGFFDYCGPKCRDDDLLPQERDKLRDDLSKLSSDLRTTSPLSTTGHHGAPLQKTHRVHFTKKKTEKWGILNDQDMMHGGIQGISVVGAVVGSPFFNKLKSDDLQFLDVITQLDGTHITSLNEDFPSYVNKKEILFMVVNRTHALPPAKKLLSGGFAKGASSVVAVLAYPGQSFGLILDGKAEILGVTSSSSAEKSGLKYGDVIVNCAVVNKENKYSTIDKDKELNSLLRSTNPGKHVILAIKRSN